MSQHSLQDYEVIAAWMAESPPDYWLFDFETRDQVDQWVQCRIISCWFSQAWFARHTGQDDPLEILVRKKTITPSYRDLIWLHVDLYQQLWAVVQLSYSSVKAKLKRLKVDIEANSARELFYHLYIEISCGTIRHCLQPYYEYSPHKSRKFLQYFLKDSQEALTSIEESNFQKYIDRKSTVDSLPLMCFVLDIAESKAKKRNNLALRGKLEDFEIAVKRCSEKQIKSLREGHSVGWKDGRRMVSGRGGSYSIL